MIEESIDNLDKNQSKELNDKLNQIINDNITNINNLTNISKYTKKNIISYMNNLTYKLESITLDEQLFESNLSDIKKNVNIMMNNDIELINNYGNLNTISNLLKNNNVNYNMTNFYNLNSLEIFDLLFDICQQFNLQIN